MKNICNNSIHNCVPFTEFMNIIDSQHFVACSTVSIVSVMTWGYMSRRHQKCLPSRHWVLSSHAQQAYI